MQFTDKVITCQDCHGEFIFTADEQIFFYDKAFKNDPKRCKQCKAKRAGSIHRPGANPGNPVIARQETRTFCSQCGAVTSVPFKPTQGRPVLCRQCFQMKRGGGQTPSLATASQIPQDQPPQERLSV